MEEELQQEATRLREVLGGIRARNNGNLRFRGDCRGLISEVVHIFERLGLNRHRFSELLEIKPHQLEYIRLRHRKASKGKKKSMAWKPVVFKGDTSCASDTLVLMLPQGFRLNIANVDQALHLIRGLMDHA